MKIKISVIIPVYNVEKYLYQCLDSILNQTLKEIEVICVDDGSTDRSYSILKEYQQKDQRIIILTQKNLRAGVARNNGMKIAQGEYLLFLDSDDFFELDMLEKIYQQAKKNSADVVIFGGRKYDENLKTYIEAPNYFKREYIGNKEVFNRFDNSNSLLSITTPAPWTKAFKKEFIDHEHLQFQDLVNSNDVYFTFMAICLAERITWIDCYFVNYRIGMKTNLQSTKAKNPNCFIIAFRSVFDELNQRGIYKDVEMSFTNAALFGIAYNIKTIPISSLKEVIYELGSHQIDDMHLLDFPRENYLRKKDYDTVEYIKKIYLKMNKDDSMDEIKFRKLIRISGIQNQSTTRKKFGRIKRAIQKKIAECYFKH